MKQRGRVSAANRAITAFVQSQTDDDRLRTAGHQDRDYWREKYDEAQAPDFQFCIGQVPGTSSAAWISGPQARHQHYELFGIPPALVQQWDAEKRKKR